VCLQEFYVFLSLTISSSCSKSSNFCLSFSTSFQSSSLIYSRSRISYSFSLLISIKFLFFSFSFLNLFLSFRIFRPFHLIISFYSQKTVKLCASFLHRLLQSIYYTMFYQNFLFRKNYFLFITLWMNMSLKFSHFIFSSFKYIFVYLSHFC
jgi:hypothetical protein